MLKQIVMYSNISNYAFQTKPRKTHRYYPFGLL